MRVRWIGLAGAGLVIAASAFIFQNCGGFGASGLSSTTLSSMDQMIEPVVIPPSAPVPGMDEAEVGNLMTNKVASELTNAGILAENSVQNPSTTYEARNPNRGLCVVRGGAGKFLAPLSYQTRPACQSICDQMSAYTNRTCLWKTSILLGDPVLDCVVKGGAFAVLSTKLQVTRSVCRAECDRFDSNANRVCDWGDERIQDPPRGNECRVFGGAGVSSLPHVITFASRTDCQNLCDANSAQVYRFCIYGKETLRSPGEATKCEIWGGAGVVLRPVVYSDRDFCVTECDRFTANPNRHCFYGQEKFR